MSAFGAVALSIISDEYRDIGEQITTTRNLIDEAESSFRDIGSAAAVAGAPPSRLSSIRSTRRC